MNVWMKRVLYCLVVMYLFIAYIGYTVDKINAEYQATMLLMVDKYIADVNPIENTGCLKTALACDHGMKKRNRLITTRR